MNSPPSILEVAQSPELPILYSLRTTAEAAERALLAAHPELEEIDVCDGHLLPISPMAAAADLLLLHLTAIEGAINRYAAQLRRHQQLGQAANF